VIRSGWRAREGVTSDFVTARIGWPAARGAPWKARGLVRALNRARVAMHGFQSGVDSFWRGAEPRTPVLWGKDKGRERPSLTLSGGKAGNTRTLRKDDGRERPSRMLSEGKARNARTLRKDAGRERPSRMLTEAKPGTPELCERMKAENARAFNERIQKSRTPVLLLSGVKSREHPYSFREQDRCSREYPCWQLGGSDLVLSVPCRAVLYPEPGYGVVAARSGVCWTRGVGRATWGANAMRGARVVRARSAIYILYLTYHYDTAHYIQLFTAIYTYKGTSRTRKFWFWWNFIHM